MKSHRKISLFTILDMWIKKDLKIYSVNALYIIFNNVKRYFEEVNGISI